MVKTLGQIMLYVRDLDENAKFWKEKMGFERVEKVAWLDGDYIYIVSPLMNSEVQFVLQNKTKIEKLSPELNLQTPSVMMQTENIDKLYQRLIKNGVKANPIVEIKGLRFFNFSDNEDNYFAIKEV